MLKKCKKCLEERPLDLFYKFSQSKDKLSYKCKLCINSEKKAKYISVKKEAKPSRKHLSKFNSFISISKNRFNWHFFDKAVQNEFISNNELTPEYLFELYTNTFYCQKTGISFKNSCKSFDHILPLSYGGQNTKNNVRVISFLENKGHKSTSTALEALNGYLTNENKELELNRHLNIQNFNFETDLNVEDIANYLCYKGKKNPKLNNKIREYLIAYILWFESTDIKATNFRDYLNGFKSIDECEKCHRGFEILLNKDYFDIKTIKKPYIITRLDIEMLDKIYLEDLRLIGKRVYTVENNQWSIARWNQTSLLRIVMKNKFGVSGYNPIRYKNKNIYDYRTENLQLVN